MGEGEVKTEGICDVDDTIFVAVGKYLEDGKSVLSWALKSFRGKKMCILHVHQPIQLVSLMKERHSESKLRSQVVKTCQELERQKLNNLLNQYVLFAQEVGIEPGKIWIEMSNVQKGIVHIISEHGIKWLVMGAAAEEYYTENMSELQSSKAIFVCQQAPVSCQIWFPCNGHLIWTRCEDSNLSRLIKLPSQVNTCTLFPQYPEKDSNSSTKTLLPTDFDENSVQDLSLVHINLDEGEREALPLDSPIKSQDSPCSSSTNFLEDELNELAAIGDEPNNDFPDAESPKQVACEGTLVKYRANKDYAESTHWDEASETSIVEKLIQSQRKELEDLFLQNRQEIQRVKEKLNQIISELQLVQRQNLSLENQILENSHTEKELEEKIIQAVNLMVGFRKKRDMLRIERDDALQETHKLGKSIKEKAIMCTPPFFAFSFSAIMEATQNLDPSMKIGEGHFGSVYKGIIRQTKVAIKMLLSGYQNDNAFVHEAEVLSRVRHPNLVTLIGACTESRSLIYEYLENGSLEDHLSGRSKKHPLPWQFRLRIASEICSVLTFLHDKRCCIVHGNLKLSNVLLDGNRVSKISGLVTNTLRGGKKLSCKDDLDSSFYQDPEVINGRYTKESDVYSFGIIILRLLTARPVSSIVRDVQCAMEAGSTKTILDSSAGDWPRQLVKQLTSLALRCCKVNRVKRPDLVTEVWPVLEPFRHLDTFSCVDSTVSRMESKGKGRIPSHFVCPIFQEVMKDPYIAADGHTYEEDAIKGWLNSGHETSPMTNLKMDHCNLIPNYALHQAIQEWQSQP